jgi:Sec-independent protein secretion pathway component TatC
MEGAILLKFGLSLFLLGTIISLNTIIPLGLDAFYSYGEKTLENFWSFDEVLNLETILLIVLITLSQIPVVSLNTLNTEKDVNFLPEFWKTLSLVIFLASGFITPTIDGYTQLSFALSAISLYLIVISILEKRVNVKFNTTSILG